MITAVLLVVLLVAIALILLAILGIANGIANNIQEAHDNIHRVRAGFERERHRFQEAVEVVERIELHVRGPGKNYIKTPAASPYTGEP